MGLPTSKRHNRNRSGRGSEIETIRAGERQKELLTNDMAEGFVTGLAKMRNVMLIFLRCSHHFRLRGSRKASHSSRFFPTLSPSLLLPFFHRHSPSALAQNSVAGSLLPHKFGFFKTPVRALVVRCFPCLRGRPYATTDLRDATKHVQLTLNHS